MDTTQQQEFHTLPQRPNRSNIVVGQIKLVKTNVYPLSLESKSNKDIICYQYDVLFEPEVPADNRDLRYTLFRLGKIKIEQLIGQFVFSGQNLFTLREITQQQHEKIKSIDNITKDNVNYSLRLKEVKRFNFNEAEGQNEGAFLQKKANKVTQLLNIIIKNVIRLQLNYKEIGRNSKFFDTKQTSRVDTLEIYKGYTCSIQPSVSGLNLKVDFACRILQTTTAYEFMVRISNNQIMANKDNIQKDFENVSVITQYNNYQIYKISQVDFSKSPLSKFFHKKTNKDITFEEYYRTTYGLILKQKQQPLLVCKKKVKQSQGQPIIETIYLVPEFCRMTGMTDEQRSDFRLMRDVSQYTKLNPDQRQQESSFIVKRLAPSIQQSGVFLSTEDPKINSIVLNPPIIQFGRGKSLTPDKSNFDMRQPIIDQKCQFASYAFIYNNKDRQTADQLYDSMQKASGVYGIQVQEPIWFEMKNNDPKVWIKDLDQDFMKNGTPQFVISLTQQNNIYSALKNFLYLDVGLEHQNVKPKSLQKNLMSVVSKILLQIASKLGHQIWDVQRPKEISQNTMLIGIETSMKTIYQNNKVKNVVGIVATLNRQFTKCFSEVELRIPGDTQLGNLTSIIKKALQTYLNNENVFPDEIIIYRQGQGEGQVQNNLNFEINAIKRAFQEIGKGYDPKFAYFQVNKKISEKFYSQDNNRTSNPVSGTIVAEKVVSKHFEFFLCAQNCNSGVCTPTKYLCLYNSLPLKEETFWQITYWQCYNYYNWQGPVRIPGCMMYAGKLANFIADILQNPAHQDLSKSLYYL